MIDINTDKMEELLGDLWSKDPLLDLGVPYRRMATEAVECIITYLSSLVDDDDKVQDEEIQAMEDYIANSFGGLGVEAVEWADEDGNVLHSIPCKPNLKFIPAPADDN